MNKVETIETLVRTLKPVQKEMLKKFIGSKQRTNVFHCSRRLGKTYLLCILSVIYALKKNDSQIRYASVTQKAARKMVHPIFKDLFNQIPLKYRGKWNSQEGAYVFQNGSMIHLAGVNCGHSDDLRGTASDLAVVDEAAFVDELGYLVDSVLMPQLLSVKDSRLIMASSSPISPSHEFVDFIQKTKVENSYYSYTIRDGNYDKNLINEFCKEAGGENSTAWLREYMNQIIVDSDYSIIPEAANMSFGINKNDKYKYFQKYVSMDIGTKDLTFIIFGYYDFLRAKLCIEREFIINGPQMTTPLIAENVKQIEKELWSNLENEVRRISDNNNLLLLQDLGYIHDCHFIPTSKDSLEAMVNEMRIWFKDDRIEISEECPLLLDSLKFGFWNESRSAWGKSKTLGHFDGVAAIMYLIRNVDVFTNPIPVRVGPNEILIEYENESYSALESILR
jgi:hypothetical protein